MKKLLIFIVILFLTACVSNNSGLDQAKTLLDQNAFMEFNELLSERENANDWILYAGNYYVNRVADRTDNNFKKLETHSGSFSKETDFDEGKKFILSYPLHKEDLISTEEKEFLKHLRKNIALNDEEGKEYEGLYQQSLNYDQLFKSFNQLIKFHQSQEALFNAETFDFYERESMPKLKAYIEGLSQAMDDYGQAIKDYAFYNEEGIPLELDYDAHREFYLFNKAYIEQIAANFNHSMQEFNQGKR